MGGILGFKRGFCMSSFQLRHIEVAGLRLVQGRGDSGNEK